MHQENRFTQQITVLEMLNDMITEDTNKAIDLIQSIENTLYVIQHKPVTLKQYLEHR